MGMAPDRSFDMIRQRTRVPVLQFVREIGTRASMGQSATRDLQPALDAYSETAKTPLGANLRGRGARRRAHGTRR
jgi:hypothetical protein